MESPKGTQVMLRTILVALKFSKAGRKAFETAVQLAKVHRAWVHVFHALDYRLMHPDVPDEKIEALTRDAEDRFREELKPLLGEYTRFRFNCWEADPCIEVCKLASDIDADVVVIGCHQVRGQPGISRLGHIGLSIVQLAPCMVLVVPCPDFIGSPRGQGRHEH